jgi:transposase InsO family protein
MGWKETSVSDERRKFVTECIIGKWSMSDLCLSHGISRKTGYKWLDRFLEEGLDGLKDRSRAPLTSPNATPSWMVKEILDVRKKYGWGGAKIIHYLARRYPPEQLPARSTADAIISRHGLTKPRRRRRRSETVATDVTVSRPNDRWAADFKGWFRTRDGARCDPFTLTDSHSRFLLCCSHTPSLSFIDVKPKLERAFREFGLPAALRTDNGAPFGSRGIGGLSQMSVWLIRLGVYPDFIDAGKPQQNGRHERMHRTLKRATASPPRASIRAQQRSFHEFRRMYNEDRPHEGLDGAVPADIYQPSERTYPNRLPELEYPAGFIVRKVASNGVVKLDGSRHFLGGALHGQYVGLEPVSEWHLRVYLGPYAIGRLNLQTGELLNFKKPRKEA